MLFIAVVDDDPHCLKEIAATVRGYLAGRGEECDIATFSNAPAFLAEALTRRFDIAILDIIMPGKSGVDAALELHDLNRDCRIVFLTSSRDYAIHGYRVDAVDYILKPIDELTIGRALDKIRKRAAAKPPVFPVILREGNEERKVEAADILFCQSEDKMVRVHGRGWEMLCRGKLDELQMRLPGHFIHTHKRFLVNLERVTAMTKEEMRLDSGDAVPISRALRESVAEQYFDYVTRKARRT